MKTQERPPVEYMMKEMAHRGPDHYVHRLGQYVINLEAELQDCRELLRYVDGDGRLDGFTGAFKKHLRRQVARLTTDNGKEST